MEPTYAARCDGCGRGCDGGLHYVAGHLDGTTPPRKLAQLTYGVICRPECLAPVRAAQAATT
jgi:hypothetical protein